MPCAVSHTRLIKFKSYSAYNIFSGCRNFCITFKVVPLLFYLHPAAGERTKFRITPFSFYLNKTCIFALILAVVAEVVVNTVDCIDTGHFLAVYIVVIAVPAVSYYNTVNIGLPVSPYTVEQSVTAGALKHAVNNLIAMSCCGNGRAPVNNGVADFAERSARVACFRAGRCLVGKCFCGVNMSAIPRVIICLSFVCGDHILRHLVHLGVDLRTFTGECIGRTVDK